MTRGRMTARIVPLASREAGDARMAGTLEERLAAVAELTAEAWRLAGRPLPTYPRATMPIVIASLKDHAGQGHRGAVDVGNRNGQGDQGHHAGPPGTHVGDDPRQERPAAVEVHRGGEHELNPMVSAEPPPQPQQLLHDVGQRHDGQGQDQGNPKAAPEVVYRMGMTPVVVVPRRRGRVGVMHVTGHQPTPTAATTSRWRESPPG